MSWYSNAYTYVREVRKSKPWLGLILHYLCNVFAMANVALSIYTYEVMVTIVFDEFSFNLQFAMAYLAFATFFFGMMMASLSQLFFAKPATVPPEYQACQDFDKKLKAITKCKKGKYLPDESCPEEIDKQRQMLDATAISMKLKFGEVDMCERIRYCYECRHFKPDRSRHCSSCGFCVLKFDHHCPYVNACINFGNYKYFLNYIFYGSCFWLLAIIGEVYAVLIFFVNLDSTKQDGFANITQLFFALSIQFIPGKRVLLDLLQYHMSLVNCNETTCEQGKPPIFKGNNSTATYNTSVHQNRMSALGWGLWMFPVKTELLDGLHYPIFYTDASPGPKMVLRPTFKGGIRSDEL